MNKNKIPDSYLFLCIEELLFQLNSAQLFSHLILKDRYFHVPIAKKDGHKMVFFCRYGTFEYFFMPVGPINMPSIF